MIARASTRSGSPCGKGFPSFPWGSFPSATILCTLIKYPDLRLVLVSMKAGTRFKQHKTSSRFAILTLGGHVRLHLSNATVEVPRGELLALDRDVSHDVDAIRQSTFLLILVRPDRTKETCHE